MAQKTIDNVAVLTTPKLMMAAIDDNFDELYALKPSVWAYVSVPAPTTVVAAGTYYPIEGTFVNDLNNFSAAVVVTPGIKYDGLGTCKFKIDLSAQVEADSANTTITLAVKKNGVLIPGSTMGAICRVAASPYPVGATIVTSLETDDEIQLVVTSDGAGDEITFDNLQTTIRPFCN